MSAKVLDFVTYRAAHPGSAVRMQVHFAPLWPVQFWIAFWRELLAVGFCAGQPPSWSNPGIVE